MSRKQDEKYMQMALDLAKKGLSFVSPNPMVGAVLVKGGEVLAKGYHTKYGALHAEAAALKKLKGKAKGATLFVNLEPCSHHGKTPPCAEAIIASGVKRVVVGMGDPNPLVNGKGVAMLRDAGIKVDVGVLADESNQLNEQYKKWIKTRNPFVLLKCAVTLDGAMAAEKGVKTPLGCVASMEMVHDLRREYDAIAVGINTVLIDDPKLTYRGKKKGTNPLRVIFDTQFNISANANVFKEEGETVIFVGEGNKNREVNAKIVEISIAEDGHIDLREALSYLGKEGIASLMLEGGAEIADSFLRQGLVDKMIIIHTPKLAKAGAPKLFPNGIEHLSFAKFDWTLVDEDVWFISYLN